MTKRFIVFNVVLLLFIVGCSKQSEHQSNNIPKYNPKVDNEYYYPKDISSTVFDTLLENYQIHAELFPFKDSMIVGYREYVVDTLSKRDRIKYRDYGFKIDITDIHSNQRIYHLVNKYEFSKLMRLDNRYYFIRQANFVEFVNGEFRFDIALSWLENKERYLMIKYFLSLDGKERFENYPKEFYEKEFPNPNL